MPQSLNLSKPLVEPVPTRENLAHHLFVSTLRRRQIAEKRCRRLGRRARGNAERLQVRYDRCAAPGERALAGHLLWNCRGRACQARPLFRAMPTAGLISIKSQTATASRTGRVRARMRLGCGALPHSAHLA